MSLNSICHVLFLRTVIAARSYVFRGTEQRIATWLREGPTWPNPCSSRDMQSSMPRPTSKWLLDISKESPQPLCAATVSALSATQHKVLLVFSLCSFLLILVLGTADRVWLCPLCNILSGIYIQRHTFLQCSYFYSDFSYLILRSDFMNLCMEHI